MSPSKESIEKAADAVSAAIIANAPSKELCAIDWSFLRPIIKAWIKSAIDLLLAALSQSTPPKFDE